MKKNKEKKDTQTRPPVIVVLGHVDHGKSSLLEAIKDLKITGSESGGITQHIGAYMISHQGNDITFIDTPGHEAFFEMRSRGTKVADIGILVVAAEEGIKEQTKEAIKHLKETGIPYLVAINKMDKKEADPERVKQELAKEEIIVESYGGRVPSVNLSAKEKTGIEELLEIVILLAEIEELEAKQEGFAEGVVIEAKKDPKKGMVATFLVQNGILRIGDVIGTSGSYGRVRSMEGFQGEELKMAAPSTPVQITGPKGSPKAGEVFYAFEKINDAKKFALEEKVCQEEGVSLQSNGEKILNIVLKVDVVGSLEAILGSISKIPQSKISIKAARADIGNVTESDVECAKAAEAEIFAFRTKIDRAAENMANREGIKIRTFDIIYELIEAIKEMAKKRLDPKIVKEEKGRVKILAVFKTQRNRQILGGKALKGDIRKDFPLEIWRSQEKVGEGKIINLKKEEKDMEKIPEGEEFGMLIESNEKVGEGDELVLYKEEKVKEEL